MKQKGIGKNDVKLLMLTPPDPTGALSNGDVDAVAVWEPWLGRGTRELGARVIGLEADYGIYAALSFVAVQRDYLKENPEAARRYPLADFLLEEKIIPKKVDMNAAFDDSFVSQVLKESSGQAPQRAAGR